MFSVPPSHRDSRGLIQIEPSEEKYFGELLRKYNSGKRGNPLTSQLLGVKNMQWNFTKAALPACSGLFA